MKFSDLKKFGIENQKDLLEIVEGCHLPESLYSYTGKVFLENNGWDVKLFLEHGELDFIDSIETPDGEELDIWNNDDFQFLQHWRGIGTLAINKGVS